MKTWQFAILCFACFVTMIAGAAVLSDRVVNALGDAWPLVAIGVGLVCGIPIGAMSNRWGTRGKPS